MDPMIYVENPRITFRRNLHRIIELYKEQTGCSKASIERAAGFGDKVLRDYLSGRRYPTPEQLQKLASVLELPVEVFFRR